MDQNMWNFNRKMKNHIQQEYWKLIWKISTLWKEYTNKIKYCNRFSCISLAKVHWWSHAPNKSITIMLIGFIYLEWSELIKYIQSRSNDKWIIILLIFYFFYKLASKLSYLLAMLFPNPMINSLFRIIFAIRLWIFKRYK
jgi:hypothetical protein